MNRARLEEAVPGATRYAAGSPPRGGVQRLLRREVWWLAALAVIYMLAQPVLFHMHRFLDYDEAVYVSQVYHGALATPFDSQRARGITWLIYPVSAFGPPVVVIRYYLLLVFGVLFFVAFRAWVPVLKMRAVLAAAVFAVSWMTLFHGTVVLPDLPVAFGCITAGGYLAQHLSATRAGHRRASRGTRALVIAAVAIGLTAVVRPPEASFFTIGALIAAVTVNWRLLVTRYLVLGLGLVLGWLPWVIEGVFRFGGVLQRLHAASGVQGGTGYHPLTTLWRYLTLTDGPLQGVPSAYGSAPAIGYIWWAVLLAGLACAAWRIVRLRDRAVAVAALGGLTLAAQYILVFTDSADDARYLLPAYGLLTVCAAAALPLPSGGVALRATAWTVIAACFAVFAVWNVHVARRIENREFLDGQETLGEAQVLRQLDPSGPCYFASQYGFPEISFASGCTGTTLFPGQPTFILPSQPPGPVYVFSSDKPAGSWVRPVPGTLRRIRLPGTHSHVWLFRAPASAIQVRPDLWR